MIREVTNKSKKHNLREDQLIGEISCLKNNDYDLWNVCCGHDIIAILSLGLRKKLGSNNSIDVRPELIEKFLRGAYEFTFFIKTRLFQSLSQWEVTNKPFIIFEADS